MIKRLLSLALCLCLLSTATVAFAANESQSPDETTGLFAGKSVDITAIAKNTAIENAPDVYSVEIVWGDMAFAWGYEDPTANDPAASAAVWNPATHQYEINGTAVTAGDKAWYMPNTEALTVVYGDKLEQGDTFVKTTQDSVMVFNHSSLPVDVAIAIDNTADDVDAIATAGIDASFVRAEVNKQLGVTVGDVYAEDSSLVNQVKLSEPTDESVLPTDAPKVVAALNVTISKVVPTP